MGRVYFRARYEITSKNFLFLAFFIPLLLLSAQSYSFGINEIFLTKLSLKHAQVLSDSSFHLFLILFGATIILCAVIMYFSLKLKKVNRELKERENQIQDLNLDLQKLNRQLSDQKGLIKKEPCESDKLYEILVQSADDGISFYDRDWNLKYANSAFYSLFDIEEDTYNNPTNGDLKDTGNLISRLKREQAFYNKGIFETELKIRNIEGKYLDISIKSVMVRNDNGEVIGALTISRDITKVKQTHLDLIKANAEAEVSNRLKSSFLANISHEIRTPLNSVVGFSNLLLSNGISKENREEYVEHINHNSEKLLQIIGDIIDLSRLESSQIEITYEETSLCSIVNEVVDEARQAIKRNEKPIILIVKNQFEDSGDLIFTDRIWLKRVLTHLMDNAVKFTLDGSIEISFSREDENIVFSISDTGVGIKKENLGRIFEEFRQEIDGHHRPFEGLGIGLTLVKEVVDRMGGKIFVQSEKGIGSEFSFSIPYRPAGSSKNKFRSINIDDQPLANINWSSKKCLLVDDNKDVLIYLSRILVDTGVTIITARTGFEAIEIIKTTPDIDVILLDMQMPEMNGIETAKEIRKIRKSLPVIAQTAFIFEDDKDIILEAGCDACLIKPIRKDHLLTVMSSFIKSN
ncbi:MAG: response regulator [Bacteroidales bacterium]|nr:response regulator [Bacteroidales bacterium]